ncbi:YdiU family protein [Aliiglaciecola sp. M165]|uniref:protein adenylyltransferase SelO n=1 Tax=Aliiglaciecola sp. M165 TaxID=2593649 RepID=UPI00117C3C86|nr:YdiU family protein [Aliiglaciecola sp. M165]TRY33985.1 YdiU family protein [Aliiglaciecola sp. M165]
MFFNHSYAKDLQDLVSPVKVAPLFNAKLRLFNKTLAQEIKFPEHLHQPESLISALFNPQSELNRHSIAQKYGGHQFGSWNPELGDGRGLLLAELRTSESRNVDLHLKGAGKTPYSRFGDGRAVLRSTIREYLASEALHHLGIPTSRALCLISSQEPVYREKQEHGAMLIRTCQSHLRFGHFEYFYHSKQPEKLEKLFQYTLANHFPQCLEQKNAHQAMLSQIVNDTADLVAKWQSFGFCHGVMNTDNMSIHGITFDFGPYAFLDNFEPGYICNHSDHQGRYAFDQQPGVALWNLNALAHAFTPYMSIDEIKETLGEYEPRLTEQYAKLMRKKLGLQQEKQADMTLVNQWLSLLENDKRDYTASFRLLSQANLSQQDVIDHFIGREAAGTWFKQYSRRLELETQSCEQRAMLMRAANPKYVLRNYLAQIAIDRAEEGNFAECERLLTVLQSPFEEQLEHQAYAKTPPDWGQSMEISCSS